jgi:predicted acetyltransferase
MEIDVVEAGADDRELIDRLVQFYAYDFSEILGTDPAKSGRFDVVSLGDWPAAGHRVFVVRVDGKPAGFASVRQGSALTGDAEVTDMSEFFVMRKYRRVGVGAQFACYLFGAHPGRWEVRELTPNVAAQAFWRAVISQYTGGAYEERIIEDERWHGPVQSFVSETT